MKEATVLDIEIPEWEWESLEIWGENKQVAGHRIKMGSIVELQLCLEPRHIIKYWIRRPDLQKKWTIDPDYDLLQELNLGKGSEPIRRLIQPLRPDTNLAYFEGQVVRIASADSKSEPGSKMMQALIDCGFPLVLEAVVDKKSSAFPVASEGEELIGICRLFGAIDVSNSLFRAPLKAKVLAARTLESLPRSVILKVEPIVTNAPPERMLFYSRLEKKH